PVLYEYERNRELGAEIFERMKGWHERHIVEAVPPPLGGSEATKDWIEERFPVHQRSDIRPATEEEIELLLDYENHKVLSKEIHSELDILANRVREAIGEREGIEWYAGRVTWRKTKDSSKTDWQGLALDLLDSFLPEKRNQILDHYT